LPAAKLKGRVYLRPPQGRWRFYDTKALAKIFLVRVLPQLDRRKNQARLGMFSRLGRL
jgi:hypothetical protein